MITVVTSLLDLSRFEARHRNVDRYLDELGILFAKAGTGRSFLVFAEPSLADTIQERARGLVDAIVVPYRLEDAGGWGLITKIVAARAENPFTPPFNAVKDTPTYAVFQRTKIELLRRASLTATTSHVAWLDAGIAGSGIGLDALSATLDRAPESRECEVVVHYRPEPVVDFTVIRQRTSAGYIAGPRSAVRRLCTALLNRLDDILAYENVVPHDETLLEDVLARQPWIARPRWTSGWSFF